jgi:PAS domain S-box-containing protein
MRVADLWDRIELTSRHGLNSWPRRYGFVLLAVAAASTLQFGLYRSGFTHIPYTWFVPTVVFVSLLAGFGPGMLATVLSTVVGGYFLFLPVNSKTHPRDDLARPALFLAAGAIMTVIASGRTRARQALRVTEDDLNRAQAVAQIGSWHFDVGNGKMRFSDEAQRILGLKKCPIISPLEAGKMVHPEDYERVRAAWMTALKTGVYDQENRVLVNGQIRWFRAQASLERDSRGQVTKATGTLQDITEWKVAQQRVQEYEQASEGLEEMILVVDRDYRYVVANRAVLNAWGVKREWLIGRHLLETMGAEAFGSIKSKLEECLQGKIINFEKRTELPLLGDRDFAVSYLPLAGPSGVERIAIVMKDITQRKQAERKLNLFRILIDHSNDAVEVVDPETLRFLDVNERACKDLGYTREEMLGFTVFDINPDADEATRHRVVEQLRAGEPILLQQRHRRKDGTTFPVEVSLRMVQLDRSYVVGIARDITRRKRTESDLQQSEERFRVALKESPVTVFNQDRELCYTWIYNPHLHLQDAAIGKTDEDILGKKAAHLQELKRRVLETGVALREYVVIPHEGKNYAIDLAIEPLFDADKKIVGITGTSIDIARLWEQANALRNAKDRLLQEKSYLESEIETELGFEEIVGQSPPLREVLKKARIVAPIDSTVLVLGESGTGKELVARAVHALSTRHEKNFIKLNCAAVPSGLLESELFGHERGAFTGAVSQKIGRVELADKGTLFLDEIGELPLELQPKLLRLLQDREFERLGGVRTLRVDVRIISATNRDLQQEVAERRFREDLFYRLNVFPIQMPTLRERRSDIPILVEHFVRKHSTRMRKRIEVIPSETKKVLENWNWPGNVRELENMIERMVILTNGPVLAAPPEELLAPTNAPDDDFEEMERDHIVRILRETNGVLAGPDGAAIRLGLKRTTLQSMLKRFGIEPREYRRVTGTVGPD